MKRRTGLMQDDGRSGGSRSIIPETVIDMGEVRLCTIEQIRQFPGASALSRSAWPATTARAMPASVGRRCDPDFLRCIARSRPCSPGRSAGRRGIFRHHLGSDCLRLDSIKRQMLGNRTGQRFRCGDRMGVRPARVGLEGHKIDVVPVDDKQFLWPALRHGKIAIPIHREHSCPHA